MPTHYQGGLVYVGDHGFAEADHAEPVIDDYGLDTLTRNYVGRTDLLDSFLPTIIPTELTPVLDATYTTMAVVGKPSIAKGRAFTTVSVRYMGKVSGAAPLPRIVDSWSEETIEATGGIGDPITVFVQLFLDFRQPSTTYEYYTQARPTVPLYDQGAVDPGLGIQIIRKRGAEAFTESVYGPIDAAVMPVQHLVTFERERIGIWWHVKEGWTWTLQPDPDYFTPTTVTTAVPP